jgi:RNA polymerase sigma factor (sigma-70 family)
LPDPLANLEFLLGLVQRYTVYRLGAGPDAEDATSETLARAFGSLHSYDASAGSPQAWLLGIARHVVSGQLSERRPVLGYDRAETSPGGESVADSAVERLNLRAALARLSPADRELLALRYGADLAVKDIAAALSVRANSVDVALHRAVTRLRKHMEALSAGDELPHGLQT